VKDSNLRPWDGAAIVCGVGLFVWVFGHGDQSRNPETGLP
jgi:hypothetical protein